MGFDALQFQEPVTDGGIWVAYDPDDPRALALEVHLVEGDDRSRLAQKHSKRRKFDIVGLNRDMRERISRTWRWKRMTPEFLGRQMPRQYPPAKVREMNAAMAAEGLTEIPYSQPLFEQLLNKSVDFSSRVDELQADAQALAEAEDAFRAGEGL